MDQVRIPTIFHNRQRTITTHRYLNQVHFRDFHRTRSIVRSFSRRYHFEVHGHSYLDRSIFAVTINTGASKQYQESVRKCSINICKSCANTARSDFCSLIQKQSLLSYIKARSPSCQTSTYPKRFEELGQVGHIVRSRKERSSRCC